MIISFALMASVLAQSPSQIPPPVPAKSTPNVTVVPKVDPPKPTEIKADCGKAITLSADAAVQWESCDTLGLVDIFPAADSKSCVFVSSVAGRYVVLAISPNSPAAKIVVLVGNPLPTPPPGPPTPTPTPPSPPVPVDPLTDKMKSAYLGDQLQLDLRRKGAESLVAVYLQAAKVIQDPAVPTIGVHSAQVKSVADQLFKDDGIALDSLGAVRKVLADELKLAFPAGPPALLTSEVRGQIASIYTRASQALKAASGT